MAKKKLVTLSNQLSHYAVESIQDKKGEDIVRLDLREIHSSLADYFIICSANSHIQVKAIADYIEKEIYTHTQTEVYRKEGFETSDWIILDYVDVVIHIFKTEKRNYYGIEELWGDAESTTYKSA